jgi:Zn-dependent protease with chaperone function
VKTRWTSGTLGTTEHVLVSCKNNQRATIEQIVVTNISGSTRQYDIYHVPKGQASGTDDALAYEVTLGSKRIAVFEGPFYLLPGDELRVKASAASSLNIFAYGDSY